MNSALKAYKREGLDYLLKTGSRYAIELMISNVLFCYYSQKYANKMFKFDSKYYNYYHSPKGQTWRTERAVEIPIIWDIVTQYKKQNKRILEIGNVLSYRFEVNHDVLDKYERVPDIINEDVISYKPPKPYDLIVSISTMEHVGWDENPRDPSKVLEGFQNLTNILAPGGKMVVTLPLGYNSYLDGLLRKDSKIFDKRYYIKRTSNVLWKETNWEDIKNIDYDFKVFCANGILIGITEKR